MKKFQLKQTNEELQNDLDLTENLQDAFDPAKTYEVGDLVIYEGKLYQCKVAIVVAGEWDSTKWEVVHLNDLLNTINTLVTSHLSNNSNPHSVTKTQVGLGNVDNTSDLDKPISTAAQTALAGKQGSLIAGTNIQIATDGKTISATDTTYSAGTNISINANNQISANVDLSSYYTKTDTDTLLAAKAADNNVFHIDTSNDWIAMSYSSFGQYYSGWNGVFGTNSLDQYANSNYLEFKYCKRTNPESSGQPHYETIYYGKCCLKGKSIGDVVRDIKGVSLQGVQGGSGGSIYYFFGASDATDHENGTLYCRVRERLPSNL